ncbi:MAG: hypothetical protein WD077_06860 [Bacteroidia bacterium]
MPQGKSRMEQQRQAVEVEKLKIQAELGAFFIEGNPELPPDVEMQFLHHIRSFHQRMEDEPARKVFDVIGQPDLVPLKDLEPKDVESSLRKLRSLLKRHNIAVDSLHEVAEEEMYRFMTEDLMQQEVIAHDIPGMKMCFTYEEFHPNDSEDVVDAATQVARDLLQNPDYEQWYHFAKILKFNGLTFSRRKDLKRYLTHFSDAYFSIEVQDVRVTDLQMGDSGSAFIKILITCKAFPKGKTTHTGMKANARIHLTNDDGWWMVDEMELPLVKK